MDHLANLAGKFLALTFRAGALRVTIDQVDPLGMAKLVIDDAAGTGARRAIITMRLLSGEDVSSRLSIFDPPQGLPTLILYPGRRRHPLGHHAPSCWFNEAGDGLLALSKEGLLVNATLTGLVSNRLVPVIERNRGRPNSSSLWLSVVALSLPISLSRRQILDATHYSGYTIDEWFKEATQNSWLTVSSSVRNRRYKATIPGIKSLAEFVEAKWMDWRQGRFRDPFGPPMRSYFIAKSQIAAYLDIAKGCNQPLIPTGITVLEQKANLAPSGTIRELAFITTKEALHAIASELDLQFSERRDISGVSEVMVLDPRHPIFGLYNEIKAADGEEWPLGLAALDSFDHPNPRVSTLSRECWRKWIDMQIMGVNAFGDEPLQVDV
jgi:hypothetical protein